MDRGQNAILEGGSNDNLHCRSIQCNFQCQHIVPLVFDLEEAEKHAGETLLKRRDGKSYEAAQQVKLRACTALFTSEHQWRGFMSQQSCMVGEVLT